jgi:hypothetical protein
MALAGWRFSAYAIWFKGRIFSGTAIIQLL